MSVKPAHGATRRRPSGSRRANHFRIQRFYEAIVPPPLDQLEERGQRRGGRRPSWPAASPCCRPPRPGAARWWLLATLLAIYPANIHMALQPERFPKYKPALLWARLPVQGLFALLTWRGTE